MTSVTASATISTATARFALHRHVGRQELVQATSGRVSPILTVSAIMADDRAVVDIDAKANFTGNLADLRWQLQALIDFLDEHSEDPPFDVAESAASATEPGDNHESPDHR